MGSRTERAEEVLSEASAGYSEEELIQEIKASQKNKLKRSKKASGSKRPASASAYSSVKTTRDLWLKAVNSATPRNKKSVNNKKSVTEYWTETLRRSGASRSMDSFSGLKKSQAKNMAYASTSHYMRQLVGTEKSTRKSMDSTTTPRAPGTPAYKSQEEYYDDIIELKKQIQSLNQDNSTIRLKARRLEEDNLKKEKQVAELLDPSKSEHMRRTLGDRKPETGVVIHSLKQKILNLEHQLKEREAAYGKLQSDLKTTKVDELKMQMEAFYGEVLRLRELKTLDASEQKKKSVVKETPSRLKAMQDTVMRMNEKNLRLQAENKSLKEDLDKALAVVGDTKTKEHYEDMSKKQLLLNIGKLEKRLDKAEESMSIVSDVETRNSNVEGKMLLEGTVAQRLDQLDKRETELIEEIKKKNETIKRLKDDKIHYRKKLEEKRKECSKLVKEKEELQAEIESYEDRGAVTPRPASARHKTRQPSLSSSGSDRQKVEKFRQKHAATCIQRNWREHNKYSQEIRQKEEATEFLQSAIRNHKYRQTNLHNWHDEDDVTDEDDTLNSSLDSAAKLIQGSVNNYKYQKGYIRESPKRGSMYSRSSRLDSEGEEIEDGDTPRSVRRPSSARHSPNPRQRSSQSPHGRSPHLSRAHSPQQSRSRSPSYSRSRARTPTPRHDDDDDDDDDSDEDIVMSKGKKFF